MSFLQDSFGRRFSYLRLSVTDACNFRCEYCLPNGYRKQSDQDFLSIFEIENLVRGFVELGTWKVRLTGGEPTLRRDLVEIVRRIQAIEGVRKIALSTNGYRLKEMASELQSAGVSALNVSVDTLDAARFAKVTGTGNLEDVLVGIDTALGLGFESVKINAVLMAGVNDQEIDSFLNWTRTYPVTIRFIELMPTGTNGALFEKHHVESHRVRQQLLAGGWSLRARGEADGPAEEFVHSDHVGRVGLIAPYSREFCKTCNRLRVTSLGALRLCLFAEGDASLRGLLQKPEQKEELKERVRALLSTKEVSHYLPEGKYGNTRTFSAMGG